jgi:hypothetical protein
MHKVGWIPSKHLNIRLLGVIEVREDAGTCSWSTADAAQYPDGRVCNIKFLICDLAAFLGLIIDPRSADGQVRGVTRRSVLAIYCMAC